MPSSTGSTLGDYGGTILSAFVTFIINKAGSTCCDHNSEDKLSRLSDLEWSRVGKERSECSSYPAIERNYNLDRVVRVSRHDALSARNEQESALP